MMGAWTKIADHALAELGATVGARGRPRRALRRPPVGTHAAVPRRAPTHSPAYGAVALPLALVTNSERRQQRRKIEQYDLARYFDGW